MNGLDTLPRGVWLTPGGRFRAEVTIDKRRYSCGSHDDPVSAEAAILGRRQRTPKRKRARGERRCGRCKRKAPACGWSSNGSWCRDCARADGLARQKTEHYRAWRAEYRARPEVMERERELRRAREKTPQRVAYNAAYNATPRARYVKNRGNAAYRLRKATDPVAAARIARTVALYDAEIARLDRRTNPEGGTA